MAAGDRTQTSAGVAAQTTGVWDVLWFPDCILALLSLPELVGLKLEWVLFPDTTTLPSHCSADRQTHTCAHTHARAHTRTHACTHT